MLHHIRVLTESVWPAIRVVIRLGLSASVCAGRFCVGVCLRPAESPRRLSPVESRDGPLLTTSLARGWIWGHNRIFCETAVHCSCLVFIAPSSPRLRFRFGRAEISSIPTKSNLRPPLNLPILQILCHSFLSVWPSLRTSPIHILYLSNLFVPHRQP